MSFYFYLIAIAIIWTLATSVIMWLDTAHGDDTEDPGTPTLKAQLLERAREWNINKAMNDTMQTAERFNTSMCFNSQDAADEYFNQTGQTGKVPCPDFTISGIPRDDSNK